MAATKLVTVLAVLALLVAVSATVVPHVGKIKPHVPRTYKISLDDPLEKRWAPVLQDYKHSLTLFMDYVDLLPIPDEFWNGVEWYAKNVFIHKDFTTEVEVLSKLSGHRFGKMFFLNFMY